jgi:predicted ferric reductase
MTATISRQVHVPRIAARSRSAFVLWIAGYTAFVILPLPLGLIDLDPGRGFWTNLSVALGFVGLSMFGMQFLMAARSSVVSHPVGMDIVLRFHRQMAYLATILVFAHPIILFLLDGRYLGLLEVFSSPLRAKFAVAACAALLLVIGLSVFRQRLRMRYDTWQLTHAVLALVVVGAALVHVLLVDYYVRQPWEQALWIALSAAFVALGVWVRIVKPLLRRHRRWSVTDIVHEAGGATTIGLQLKNPGAYGARGFRFEAGQFAWIQARRSPFALTYHPFSFSSSDEHPDRVTFTVKQYDGFSREVADLQVGEIVYLDGPFGSFVLPDGRPLVLVAAGVGVTPLLSMLETLADRGSTLPMTLWLGNRDEASITCGEQLASLQARMDLDVVHVLSHPGAGWSGAVGRIDESFVSDRLAQSEDDVPGLSLRDRVYLICGPSRMMDAVERALVAGGLRSSQIRSERFEMV